MALSLPSMSKGTMDPPLTVPSSHHLGGAHATRANVKYFQRGIYTVAYDPTSPMRAGDRVHNDVETCSFAGRLLYDTFLIAPALLILHFVCTLWASLEPALNLHLSALLLALIEESLVCGKIPQYDLNTKLGGYLILALTSAAMSRIHTNVIDALRGHLRAKFWPPAVKASLLMDFAASQDFRETRLLPKRWHFDTEAPGWNFIFQLSEKIRVLATITLTLFSIMLSLGRLPSPDREILTVLCLSHPVIFWFSPKDGVGGAAHFIWTDNVYFMRLKALFIMTFSEEYRHDLITHGATEFIQEEYQNTLEQLGPVPDSAHGMRWGIPRAWYWMVLDDLVLYSPLAMYFLTFPWLLSPSSLASICLLQQAAFALRFNVAELLHDSQRSFGKVFLLAKDFYDARIVESTMCQGMGQYPVSRRSSERGMKISLTNVSFRYANQQRKALENVSINILPGQLVLLVGANGSGKSTLVKLLARLFDPESGTIVIDDIPLRFFDIAQIRGFMTFISQHAEIFPVSLRENLLFGIKNRGDIGEYDIEEAARMSGAYDLITNLPRRFDTILEPLSTSLPSMGGCPGGASPHLEALMQHVIPERTSISAGEKQRILASRAFLRLNHTDSRLVVADEPGSALDSVAEDELFSQFIAHRKGKTMIFVTHRFKNLAKHADLILCMKDGRIIGRGTHNELMTASDGEYANLYRTQDAGSI